jgi:hypothetical protein
MIGWALCVAAFMLGFVAGVAADRYDRDEEIR